MDKQNQNYLSGDSAHLGVINTAVTRGGKEVHSRGGVGTGPQFHFCLLGICHKDSFIGHQICKIVGFQSVRVVSIRRST